MRPAGPKHMLKFQERDARAVAHAVLAEQNATIAIQNEENTRIRVERLEKYLAHTSRANLWQRLKTLFVGPPVFIEPEVTFKPGPENNA